jgi:hypothetical protein
MCGPPDPEMRNRPAANGTAYRKGCIEPHQLSEAVYGLQAEKLRRLFSFCQATACTVARLAFAVSR